MCLTRGKDGAEKACTVPPHLPTLRAYSVASVVSDFVILWTLARQTPLSMGRSRQEYWSGLPFPSPGDLPSPGMELSSQVSCIGRRVLYH